jgi:hypothetical protein
MRLSSGGRGPRWASWVVRDLLVFAIAAPLLAGFGAGAILAGVGLALSMLPLAIGRLLSRPVPWKLELPYVLGVALEFVSEAFNVFEWYWYWDKLVHFGETFLLVMLATFLLLGYLELYHLELPDRLSAGGLMFFGLGLGAAWEIVEFVLDRFVQQALQTSNAGTVLDLAANSVGAILGTLVALWLYRHRTSRDERTAFGQVATWLTAPPSGRQGR